MKGTLCRVILLCCFLYEATTHVLDGEINYITNKVKVVDPPFCPSKPEDFVNWNHSLFLTDLILSYNKNTPQYHSLSYKEKAKRVLDDANTSWVNCICPEVVEYFSFVKYNDFYDNNALKKMKRFRRQSNDVSMTHAAAMASVCMMRVVDIVAKRLKMKWALIAGSHLGAGLHGGPIPWDDDADIIIDFRKKESFVNAIESFTFENRKIFGIYQGTNALKMWIIDPTYTPLFDPDLTDNAVFVRYPYLDIFSFKMNQIVETGRRKLPRKSWDDEIFDRIRLYFFGGIMLPGLPWDAAPIHYNVSKCIVAASSHRGRFSTYNRHHGEVFCCHLTKYYPFVYRFPSRKYDNIELEVVAVDKIPVHVTKVDKLTKVVLEHGYLRNGNNNLGSLQYSKSNAYDNRLLYKSPQSRFEQWISGRAWQNNFANQKWGSFSTHSHRESIKRNSLSGTENSLTIPNLNAIEVDNSISPTDNCKAAVTSGTQQASQGLKVITYNAKRGGNWFDFVLKIRGDNALQNPDVIILNEMDNGMARSGNLHTARMMAFALKMNYAWGLEFIELTNGNKEEHEAIRDNEADTLALHGNAILSKCQLYDGFIIRSKLNEKYFSDKPTFVNAFGYEKRIGGRMGLFVYINTSFASNSREEYRILIGSIHKIQSEQYDSMIKRIKEAHSRGGTIVGGDQIHSTCNAIGLKNLDNSSSMTFPASCTSEGNQHGDILCSDLSVTREVSVHLPCLRAQSKAYDLSDHALLLSTVTI